MTRFVASMAATVPRWLARSSLGAILLAVSSLVPAMAQAADPILTASNSTGTTLNFQLAYTDTPTYFRLYLDTDRNATSGFPAAGVGAEYLVENGSLYRYTGVSGSWSWSLVGPSSFANAGGSASWSIAASAIGSPATLDLIGQVQAPLLNSTKFTYQFTPAPQAAGQDVTYTASTAIITNPERGLFHYPGNCNDSAYSLSELKGYRTTEGVSLVMCHFLLKEFVNTPISAAALEFFQTQMNTLRAAGLKTVLRFSYSESVPGTDATPAQVAAHLDQLAPYLSRNSDVIYIVQTGLIGAWGEWYYTTNYGTEGNVTAADWNNRKAVIDKLLQTIPPERRIQIRTPDAKRRMYGTTTVSAATAFNDSAQSRVGHHNDCFLAAYNDQGTYVNTSVEYPYLEAETTYLPMGGETCQVTKPRSACPTALSEMSRFHWSYLNVDYHPQVIAGFKTGGCFPQIRQKLGYRFVLQNGSYSGNAKPGGAFNVSFSVRNDGWAAPFNARGAELILRNTTSGALYRFTLTADPRRWLPGQVATISQSFIMPATAAAGNYSLLLNLHDPAPTLRDRSEYAIQLANANVWEASTGFNKLLHTMAVAP